MLLVRSGKCHEYVFLLLLFLGGLVVVAPCQTGSKTSGSNIVCVCVRARASVNAFLLLLAGQDADKFRSSSNRSFCSYIPWLLLSFWAAAVCNRVPRGLCTEEGPPPPLLLLSLPNFFSALPPPDRNKTRFLRPLRRRGQRLFDLVANLGAAAAAAAALSAIEKVVISLGEGRGRYGGRRRRSPRRRGQRY